MASHAHKHYGADTVFKGKVPEPKPNARKCQGLRQTDGGTNSAGTCFG